MAVVSILFKIFIGFIIIVAIYRLTRGWIPSESLGSWRQSVDDFNYSTHEFYNQLSEKIHNSGVEDIETKTVNLSEGNFMFSAKRSYLRITWKRRVIDVCAAPFGNGYFFSWWLFEKGPMWHQVFLVIPVIGKPLLNLIVPNTYYKIDTNSMFQSMVHSRVVELIDSILKDHDSQGLTQEQKKPTHTDLLKG
ncbi:MAG: hypothetical protein WD048_13130 [Chitinophagales bacterium]